MKQSAIHSPDAIGNTEAIDGVRSADGVHINPNPPVWWIEWKSPSRTRRIDTVPLSDESGLGRAVAHAAALADGPVTVTHYWPGRSNKETRTEIAK